MAGEPSVFSKILAIRFPAKISDQPIITQAVKRYNLDFNILRANISPGKEGMLVMELRGHRKNFEDSLKFFREHGLQVKTIGQEVSRDEEKCYHCGACLAVCPTGALRIEGRDRRVIFDREKCMACEMCVTACPPRAMEVGHKPRPSKS